MVAASELMVLWLLLSASADAKSLGGMRLLTTGPSEAATPQRGHEAWWISG